MKTFVSFSSYITVKAATNTSNNVAINLNAKKMLLFLSIFLGLFWSTMPYFGWSYYSFGKNFIEKTLNKNFNENTKRCLNRMSF